MTVKAIIKLTAKAGSRDELMRAMAAPVAATAAHPECLAVELLDCVEDQDQLLLIEQWTSQQAHVEFIQGVIAEGGLEPLLALLATEMETFHYIQSE